MYLNTLSPAENCKKNKRRLGRGIGSGLGKTGGRGHKGQKSRSGCNIHRGFAGGQMSIYRRLPKFGFSSRKAIVTSEVYLSDLTKVDSIIIDIKQLKIANIINRNAKLAKVILAGKISKPVIIRGLQVTRGARIAIEAAGGTVEDSK